MLHALSQDTNFSTPEKNIHEVLNSLYSQFGLERIQILSKNHQKRESYGKKRIGDLINAVAPKIRKVLGTEEEYEKLFDTKNKIAGFDNFMTDIKNKLTTTTSRNEKIKLLTLVPDTMSLKQAANFLEVSVSRVWFARNLKLKKGILSVPDSKKPNSIAESTVQIVKDVYHSNSRCLPGKKDFVSVNHEHLQKHLILLTLRELYVLFKEKFNSMKLGFSKFCSLRPPECVLAGASGTHCVCVS